MHKLNKFIKPDNIQITSKKLLERIEVDITYFGKKIELIDLKNKYLLNFTDHFSKLAKCFLIEDKTSEAVLIKFKEYIKEIGKPSIIHSDIGGEFSSNNFKLFCLENRIKIVKGAPYHQRSQGAVEKFNDNIISKLRYLRYFKLE